MASRRVQAVEIHAEYAYYLGIIDYQQEYNFRKKVFRSSEIFYSILGGKLCQS